MAEGIRLQKYLSRAGRASRREAERLMSAGRVVVNGEVASELGMRVVPGRDRVEVDGTLVSIPEARWIAFHKTAGVLTTRSDPHGGLTIYDLLPADLGALRYIGRLDRDTEGLLLMTNDGDAANRLQHPSGEVEREYRAVVEGVVSEEALSRLRAGIELDDGFARPRRAEILERSADTTTLTVVLTEGRNREVRRLLYAIGHEVRTLVRLRFGSLELGDLAPGAWRDLTDDERESLLAVAGGMGN